MSNQPNVAITGWKALNISESGLLTSPQQHTDWRPREPLSAYCGYAHDLRDLAYEQCSCGVYSVSDPRKTLDYLVKHYNVPSQTSCLAQIAMWGWVHEGSTGFRAQFAYPKQLIAHPSTNKSLVAMAGEMYAIPVMYLESDEWNEFIGIATQAFVHKTYDDIDLTKFTKKQIQAAVRAKKRHTLYMKIRNLNKTLDAKYDYQMNILPRQIKELQSKIQQLIEERDAL